MQFDRPRAAGDGSPLAMGSNDLCPKVHRGAPPVAYAPTLTDAACLICGRRARILTLCHRINVVGGGGSWSDTRYTKGRLTGTDDNFTCQCGYPQILNPMGKGIGSKFHSRALMRATSFAHEQLTSNKLHLQIYPLPG
jgi:hypothetical protein